ncbi:hypothetical protein GCM10011348_31190 [Marinobacterium nitratireducens]|uniref:Uncharacterized protein n=1 Tax=Marinobacterium nitratireducens TaxID=518897 RepID=A0A918DV46_9GAMM|nr:hypothetical protein [Marinobacterium nitratireducens]GGO84597.1 hypothetical protein GCM10011348_31190 [Marinobacterium nitratireducens]
MLPDGFLAAIREALEARLFRVAGKADAWRGIASASASAEPPLFDSNPESRKMPTSFHFPNPVAASRRPSKT